MPVKLHEVVGALNQDQLVPFFQPLIELRSGRLRGFEVLARWQHPEHGPILPSNFISLAEEHGLVASLTQQICRKAFLAARTLPDDLTLAVNVSPLELCGSALPTQIRENAESTGFPLHRLTIEITESALHHDLQQAQRIAAELKAMGCKLALDDFGTGYSSLRHLQSFHFDQLKIDRSFISTITERASRKIVASVIGLGQSLNLTMVAEGVETEEQADLLIWLGCERAQGWRYGRPQGANKLHEMLAAEPIPAHPGLSTPGEDWATSSLEALPTLRLAQLQAIYDGVPLGLCFLDTNLRLISINQRLADMNRCTVKDHLGRSFRELCPEAFPCYEQYLLRALQGEAILDVGYSIPGALAADAGSEMLASYQPAWDEANEVIGISVSILDITQHKLTGQAALEGADSPDRPGRITPETPWVMDSEGNDLQVSSRWVRTTPLGKDSTRNLRWLEALHIDDLAPTIRAMKHALQSGVPIDVEYRVMDMNGEWRWMRSRGTPRFAATGEISRWYGSVEDIHDCKMQQLASANGSAGYHHEHHAMIAGSDVPNENWAE